MTVAYATLGPALSPGWVTSEKRIWRKHGLDVDLVYLGGGSRSVPALLSGSIQLFMGSDTAAYVAAIQGAGVVKLGVTMNTLGYFLMTAPEIRRIADLKGKVLGIGLGRDLPYAHLTKLLRDNGIDPKTDVKILPLGGEPGGCFCAQSRKSPRLVDHTAESFSGGESWVKSAHEDRRANPGRRTEYKPVLAG